MAKKKKSVTKKSPAKKKVPFKGGSRKKATVRGNQFAPPKIQGPISL